MGGYNRCCIPGCNFKYREGIALRGIPKSGEVRRKWLEWLGQWREIIVSKYTAVCEVHFEPTAFEAVRADGKRKLKQNAVPTLFEGTVTSQKVFGDHTYFIQSSSLKHSASNQIPGYHSYASCQTQNEENEITTQDHSYSSKRRLQDISNCQPDKTAVKHSASNQIPGYHSYASCQTQNEENCRL